MLKVVHDETEANATGAVSGSSLLLDEIVRDGARQMLDVRSASTSARTVSVGQMLSSPQRSLLTAFALLLVGALLTCSAEASQSFDGAQGCPTNAQATRLRHARDGLFVDLRRLSRNPDDRTGRDWYRRHADSFDTRMVAVRECSIREFGGLGDDCGPNVTSFRSAQSATEAALIEGRPLRTVRARVRHLRRETIDAASCEGVVYCPPGSSQGSLLCAAKPRAARTRRPGGPLQPAVAPAG
jgi:hypothetical protein